MFAAILTALLFVPYFAYCVIMAERDYRDGAYRSKCRYDRCNKRN